jgi:hypothetical protein
VPTREVQIRWMAPPWRVPRQAFARPDMVRARGIEALWRTVNVAICQRPPALRRHLCTLARRSARMRTEQQGQVQMWPHVRTPSQRVFQLPGVPVATMAGPSPRQATTPHPRSRWFSVTRRKPALSVVLASLPSRFSEGLASLRFRCLPDGTSDRSRWSERAWLAGYALSLFQPY